MTLSDDLFGDPRSHLAAIVESSNDAILSKNLDGVIQSWNAGAERLFGYAAAEAIGQPVTLLIPPELRREENEILVRIRRGERVEPFETVRVAKDGRRIDVSLTVSPVRDRSGAITGASKTARDITERKRAAEALAEQREWFRVTLSSVGDAVIATDSEGRVTFLNNVAQTLTGWSAAEAAGQALAEVFHIVNELTRHRMTNPTEKVKRTGHVVGLANHTVLIRRDGAECPIMDSAAPILDREGKVIGVVLVFHDITDARRAETARERLLEAERLARAEAERASRLKDEFVATVSHELRTPLNAIVGWAHMLRAGSLDEATAHRALGIIERNAQAQATLLSDLLDISRILSGKLSIERRHVAVKDVVESAVHAIEPTSKQKGVALAISVEGDSLHVRGDAARLEQVLSNLLANAMEFTPAGGRVEVALRREEQEGVLTVRDTGRGIASEFLPFVFDRFRQADASTTRRHGGLGLGLAIVRHLVELHGGRVAAESPGVGQGATFTVRLPLADSSGAVADCEQAGSAECPQDMLAGQLILVVDDEPDTLELMSFGLQKCGADVVSAPSVEEALRVFERSRPHVVVSDIGMPGRDGYELVRAIRSLPAERGGTVPAIAMTAFAGREDRDLALAAGFQDHIAKPVTPPALAALVRDVLKRQRPKSLSG